MIKINTGDNQTTNTTSEVNNTVKKDNWELFWNIWKELKVLPYSAKKERMRKLSVLQDFLNKASYSEKSKYYGFFEKLRNATVDENGKVILDGESNL